MGGMTKIHSHPELTNIFWTSYFIGLLLSHFSRVWLCDPIESGPPGSPVPGIPQARTLEWVAISFSNFIGQTTLFLCSHYENIVISLSKAELMKENVVTIYREQWWWRYIRKLVDNNITVSLFIFVWTLWHLCYFPAFKNVCKYYYFIFCSKGNKECQDS